ncbi:hypothetical protein ACFQUU_27015 [Herbaspirillum sp. GCM10030257]|uniref:hypothetical protein n=1 Tax=Herbaspirillum sp. GCM10030257 TaxID=3273393 RepID=UPI00360AD2D8
MKSVKYLDDLAAANNLKNDNQLAQFMGWQSGTVTNYRKGRRVMDNEACLAVALKLGIDPMPIIMAADIDRAERAGQHSLWEVFSQRMAAPASVVLATLFATNFLSPQTAEAASRLAPQQKSEAGVKIMLNEMHFYSP